MEITKNCKYCQEPFLVSGKEIGPRLYCRPEHQKLWRDEWRRNYQLKRWRETKAAMDKQFGPCVRCNTWRNLEYDHIDPKTKSFNIKWSYSRKKLQKELAKCQCLCARHHRDKTSEEQRKLFTGRRITVDTLTGRRYYVTAAELNA